MAKRMRGPDGPMAQERRRRQRAWTVAGLAVAALVVAATAVTHGNTPGSRHPTPRAASAQPAVVPAAQYAAYPRVAQTYEMAAAVPMILDGIYCHCHCAEHSGHYSLLDCFSSDHAAHCDICMSEAVIAHKMHQTGASLAAIRAEVDRMYGT